MQRSFFLYTASNDIVASRRFYRELVGLEEIWHEPGRSVAYTIADTVQLAIDHDPEAVPLQGWSAQPGWVHGLPVDPPPPLAGASWSVALEPGRFGEAVTRLQDAQTEALRPEPFWVGYWSYVVRDPMGQTVELSDPFSPGPTEELV